VDEIAVVERLQAEELEITVGLQCRGEAGEIEARQLGIEPLEADAVKAGNNQRSASPSL
jgi:hypothetical protein